MRQLPTASKSAYCHHLRRIYQSAGERMRVRVQKISQNAMGKGTGYESFVVPFADHEQYRHLISVFFPVLTKATSLRGNCVWGAN